MEHWAWDAIGAASGSRATTRPMSRSPPSSSTRCVAARYVNVGIRTRGPGLLRRDRPGAPRRRPMPPDVDAALRRTLRGDRHAVSARARSSSPASATCSAATTPATTATCGPRSSATTCSAGSPARASLSPAGGGRLPARDPGAERLPRRRCAGPRVPGPRAVECRVPAPARHEVAVRAPELPRPMTRPTGRSAEGVRARSAIYPPDGAKSRMNCPRSGLSFRP